MGQKAWLLICLAVVMHISTIADAQTVAQSLTELSSGLKSGDTVYVSEAGARVEGKFIELSASSLALSINGRRREFSAAAATRVDRERHATKKGALIGLVAGAGAFESSLIQCSDHGCDDRLVGLLAVILGGLGGGIGAATGAVIGANIKHRETTFVVSGPSGSRTLTLIPFVDRARKGVALSIRF